jgi:hypothetical protein
LKTIVNGLLEIAEEPFHGLPVKVSGVMHELS